MIGTKRKFEKQIADIHNKIMKQDDTNSSTVDLSGVEGKIDEIQGQLSTLHDLHYLTEANGIKTNVLHELSLQNTELTCLAGLNLNMDKKLDELIEKVEGGGGSSNIINESLFFAGYSNPTFGMHVIAFQNCALFSFITSVETFQFEVCCCWGDTFFIGSEKLAEIQNCLPETYEVEQVLNHISDNNPNGKAYKLLGIFHKGERNGPYIIGELQTIDGTSQNPAGELIYFTVPWATTPNITFS